MKTSNSSVSTSNLNSNLSSADVANGQNLSSIRHSPRNVSQEDQEMVGRPTNLTLPGLCFSMKIFEILLFSMVQPSHPCFCFRFDC